jgi:transposase, IS6 family
MNAFKLRRFHALVILQCVRWYSKYAISYRQLEEMMAERGVAVDHTTIWRWIQRYAPQLEKEIRWYQGYTGGSWRVDETCIRVNGEWKWLFRAVDKQGRTVDFLLTHRRNGKAARHFLAKALKTRQNWPPHVINTDKNPAYGEALRQLKRDDPDVWNIEHPSGEISKQPHRGRSRPDQAAVPSNARVQVDEDRLRHHQRLRGYADDP